MGTFGKLIKEHKWSGLIVFLRIKHGLTKGIRIDSLRYPVWLRPNTSDVTTFKHIFVHGDYKFDINPEPQTIIDAGANIGLASVYFTNKYPQARIIAIELAPSNFEQLLKNTGNYANIKAVNAGLWHRNETLKFKEEGVSPWGYKVENEIEEECISVPGITMDEIIEKHNINLIDILKVDIEGAEVELFSQNFENWLPNVRCLVIETHDRSREESTKTVVNALSRYNFSSRGQVGENLVFINDDLQ